MRILCAFTLVAKNDRYLRLVCLFFCLSLCTSTAFSGRILWNFILGKFTKNCRRTLNSVKIRHEYRALCVKTSVRAYGISIEWGQGNVRVRNFMLVRLSHAKCLLASSYLRSTCLHVSVRLPTEGFSWNFLLATFTKICGETPDLVKIEQKYCALYLKTSVCIVLFAVTYAAQQRTHDFVCMPRLRICITLFTATCVRQEQKGKELLRFHGNLHCLPSFKYKEIPP